MTDKIELLRKTVLALPEWMIFGNYDTPRCLWCKGFQYPGLYRVIGHKKNCLRQRALQASEEEAQRAMAL